MPALHDPAHPDPGPWPSWQLLVAAGSGYSAVATAMPPSGPACRPSRPGLTTPLGTLPSCPGRSSLWLSVILLAGCAAAAPEPPPSAPVDQDLMSGWQLARFAFEERQYDQAAELYARARAGLRQRRSRGDRRRRLRARGGASSAARCERGRPASRADPQRAAATRPSPSPSCIWWKRSRSTSWANPPAPKPWRTRRSRSPRVRATRSPGGRGF